MPTPRAAGLLMLSAALVACDRAGPPSCPPPPVCPPSVAATAVIAPAPEPERTRAFALHVRGPASNEDKVRRCREQIRAEGGRMSERAPIVATLTLDSTNRLRIRSAARGVISDESLPPWTMWDLCRELSHRAMRAARSEPATPSGPG